jgi:hypothetical protein
LEFMRITVGKILDYGPIKSVNRLRNGSQVCRQSERGLSESLGIPQLLRIDFVKKKIIDGLVPDECNDAHGALALGTGERVLFRSEAFAQAYGAAFIARISAAISRLREATARL